MLLALRQSPCFSLENTIQSPLLDIKIFYTNHTRSSIYGFKWIKYFNYVSLPIRIGILMYVIFNVGKQGGFDKIMNYRPEQPLPLLVGLNLAVSSIALMGVIGGDYFRPIKTRGYVAIICSATIVSTAFIPAINGLLVSLLSYCAIFSLMIPELANKNLSLGAKLIGGFVSCAIITIAAGELGMHGLASLATPENAA